MKDGKSVSRRGFLKAAASFGAALTITPAFNKVKAARAVLNGRNGAIVKMDGMEYRTLGSGKAAMKVSAL